MIYVNFHEQINSAKTIGAASAPVAGPCRERALTFSLTRRHCGAPASGAPFPQEAMRP